MRTWRTRTATRTTLLSPGERCPPPHTPPHTHARTHAPAHMHPPIGAHAAAHASMAVPMRPCTRAPTHLPTNPPPPCRWSYYWSLRGSRVHAHTVRYGAQQVPAHDAGGEGRAAGADRRPLQALGPMGQAARQAHSRGAPVDHPASELHATGTARAPNCTPCNAHRTRTPHTHNIIAPLHCTSCVQRITL